MCGKNNTAARQSIEEPQETAQEPQAQEPYALVNPDAQPAAEEEGDDGYPAIVQEAAGYLLDTGIYAPAGHKLDGKAVAAWLDGAGWALGKTGDRRDLQAAALVIMQHPDAAGIIARAFAGRL